MRPQLSNLSPLFNQIILQNFMSVQGLLWDVMLAQTISYMERWSK
jgi:hypothetical protein